MSVNLVKGQKISLEKIGVGTLNKVFMGLGWDPAHGDEDIDLDASCLCYDENRNIVDVIYFGKLNSADGSILHSGDNLTGEGEGDDEVINVDLSKVSSKVTSIVFTINSYSGQTFNDVVNCFARLVDSSNNKELCKYILAEQGPSTAMAMAKVYKHSGVWKINAMGNALNGKTAPDLVETIKKLI